MSESIRVASELTDEERQRLFGWGENIFGIEDSKYTWRPKDIHVILDVDGKAASHVGLVDHTVNVSGKRVRVGGVGGVATNGLMHGRGYAQKTLRYAEKFMCEELKVEFGLLFCLDRLKPFYERQNWQLLQEPVEFDQPSGKMISPLNVMVLPCTGERWPAGAIYLDSLPW
jgi:aminoglycoside 2'-N-acetyltransferase I